MSERQSWLPPEHMQRWVWKAVAGDLISMVPGRHVRQRSRWRRAETGSPDGST